jgi:tetratricopeptide (TPR) repeat protein
LALGGPLCAIAAAISVETKDEQTAELINLAVSYQTGVGAEQDLDIALEYYEDALKFDPELFPALLNSGQIYYQQERFKKAIKRFKQAAAGARESGAKAASLEARALSGLGSCYQKTDKIKTAEKWFRAAIRKDPQLVEAHYNLVNLLVSGERVKDAQKALAIAQRLAPDTKYGIFEGRLKAKQGQEETKAVSGKVAIVAVIALLIMYSFYLRMARRRASR